MATLQTRLQDLATRIGTECKSIRASLVANVGDRAMLSTTAKANLVDAINELKTITDTLAASGGATINDALTASTTQTYSITKINQEIADTAAAVKAEILNGASGAYDTLKELEDFLVNHSGELNGILTSLSNRVRTDVNNQGLSAPQRQNARTNIDAFGSTELGNPDTNLVTSFEAGLT